MRCEESCVNATATLQPKHMHAHMRTCTTYTACSVIMYSLRGAHAHGDVSAVSVSDSLKV